MTPKIPIEYIIPTVIAIVFLWALAVDWMMERGFQKRIKRALRREKSLQDMKSD